jgi:TatD DNase family protein
VPAEALVLETDAPDISPVWLHSQRNTPEELPRIGAALAELRGMPVDEIARLTTANAQAALPRLRMPA